MEIATILVGGVGDAIQAVLPAELVGLAPQGADPTGVVPLVVDLLLVLAAGLVSGIICKRLGISMLVGYLIVGAVVGNGGFKLVSQQNHELRYLAETGALLLLFSIGIEFSLEELVRLSRYLLVGGSVQMVLVAVPVAGLCMAMGLGWPAAVLVGSATGLSSTVLVFKALEEWGHASTPHGRRAVGILVFQDMAFIPLMLLVPLLAGAKPGQDGWQLLKLLLDSAGFVAAVPLVRIVVSRWVVPLLAALRSTELVVLFSITLLGAASLMAYAVGLPAALGAFAAGLILGGNRLSGQIDALILPYRETFSAVFFVSLGTLMEFGPVAHHPGFACLGLVGVIVLKTGAAAVALRVIGLSWRIALGVGLGLSQLGELSFILLSDGVRRGVLSVHQYEMALFVALGTLILTPLLIRIGLHWADPEPELPEEEAKLPQLAGASPRALVVGLGPIGGQVASQLELLGMDVCLIDLSPVNLHRFAQQGFRTVAGDACDPDVLEHAGVRRCQMVVVTVPDDRIARQVVIRLRAVNSKCTIVVRCRYQSNAVQVKRSGADAVISEESEASSALVRLLEQMKRPGE